MISGSSGQFRVRFEAGSDVKVRELELRRLAADLQRSQPPGTYVNVNSSGTETFSSFVMTIHVLGIADRSEDRRVGKEWRSRWSPYR